MSARSRSEEATTVHSGCLANSQGNPARVAPDDASRMSLEKTAPVLFRPSISPVTRLPARPPETGRDPQTPIAGSREHPHENVTTGVPRASCSSISWFSASPWAGDDGNAVHLIFQQLGQHLLLSGDVVALRWKIANLHAERRQVKSGLPDALPQ